MPGKYENCPCSSGKVYSKCCLPYHRGNDPANAEILMRSRYSAYACGLVDYIVATTDPLGPLYKTGLEEASWRTGIADFSRGCRFTGLKIHDFVDGEPAYVTFTAYLRQLNGEDASFTEKSRFFRRDGRWLYSDGESL